MNNCQVDIIIIGDSKNGNKALKALAPYKNSIKIAFISRDFKSTTTFDHLNVEYIKQEVLFIDYKNRLFGCHLANGVRIYGTHIIVASGLKYEPFKVNNKIVPNVFNTLVELPKYSRELPAIVIGKDKSDAKFTLDVAKKFKHVFLCTETFQIPDVSTSNLKKLQEAPNIVMLPNTAVNKIILEEDQLKAVELTNYSTVTCSAIFVKTKSTPEIDFIPKNLVQRTDDNFLVTDAANESLVVPKFYATGNCAVKSTKQMFINMINAIKKDFEEVI